MSGADANVREVPGSPSDAARLDALGIVCVRADNPSLLTLSGTNSWVVGRDPAYVIDPGPALPAHLDRLAATARARGGLGGIALTHDHGDHAEGVRALRERLPAPVAAARGGVDVLLGDGERFGPLRAIATPGHATDHLAFVRDGACFTGDAVLGEGSVFIAPEPGALGGYLVALERLRALELTVLCPGHGPPVWDAAGKLSEYLEHRRERERALVDALAQGRRTVAELLDAAWGDVPEAMRPVAAITLAAHLDKLAEEGRLPDGVERPSW